ncbi:MAG: class III extradiol ring-cleavage dioxygenase [Pseudomonadota bacterium]
MNSHPALFVSHGSPMLALEDCPARRFLQAWPEHLERPRAVLMVSAHWENKDPAVSNAQWPPTIHDFGGFPRELYEIRYAAPGAPEIAEHTATLLRTAGFNAKLSDTRGLDHGAWVPLSLMYPDADIPVFQLSLIQGGSPARHYQLGAALQPLRTQGVLIIGSGSLTHNLSEFRGHRMGDPAPLWVSEFADWIAEALSAGRIDDLLNYRTLAPHAARNHPTEDHLLPLFVALGAAGKDAVATRVHQSNTYGILAMDAYTFSTSL